MFGGEADAGGGFATTQPITNQTQAVNDLALKPEWGNSCMYVEEIHIPPRVEVNYGIAGCQPLTDLIYLPGGAEQVLLPEGWDLNWITQIYPIY